METAYVFGTRDLFFHRSENDECDEKNDKDTKLIINEFDTQCSENISINLRDFHSRFSGTLDEDILNAIERHISTKCDAQESKEARKHAYELIQYILQKSQEIEPRLKMKIVESGSFFSYLRVGMPYEFDFMLDITSTFSDGELDYGYSVEKILDPKKSWSDIETFLYRIHLNRNNGLFKNTKNYLNSRDVKDLICGLFQGVIENGECKTRWNIHHYSNTGTTLGPAFQLSLYFKDTAILIDLVPCLKFPASDTRKELPPLQYTTQLLLKTLLGEDQLVTYLQNLPEKLFLVCKPDLFRLSTSQIEKDIYLNHLDPKLLQALKIAKYYFQIFFIYYGATNEDTFGNQSDGKHTLIFHNSHPFSSKSYMSSYMITNLFFHFLKMGKCFPSENSDKSAFSKDIVIMFLNFVYDVIGHQMPLAILRKNRWKKLLINIHGWCFCRTNTISVKFEDTMHSYFRHSMAEYIKVLQNILSVFELDRFPLIGRRLEFCCVKCFDKNLLFEMVKIFTQSGMQRGLCQLHAWTHQSELQELPFYP